MPGDWRWLSGVEGVEERNKWRREVLRAEVPGFGFRLDAMINDQVNMCFGRAT